MSGTTVIMDWTVGFTKLCAVLLLLLSLTYARSFSESDLERGRAGLEASMARHPSRAMPEGTSLSDYLHRVDRRIQSHSERRQPDLSRVDSRMRLAAHRDGLHSPDGHRNRILEAHLDPDRPLPVLSKPVHTTPSYTAPAYTVPEYTVPESP